MEHVNERVIDLNRSIFELCGDYPELAEVMADMGFKDITKPGMLSTAGRFMTIPKGASVKKIDLEFVKSELRERGFKVME